MGTPLIHRPGLTETQNLPDRPFEAIRPATWPLSARSMPPRHGPPTRYTSASNCGTNRNRGGEKPNFLGPELIEARISRRKAARDPLRPASKRRISDEENGMSASGTRKGEALKSDGLIGWYNLERWWFEALTEAERNRIEDLFHPMGCPIERPLTQGDRTGRTGDLATPTGLLHSLVGWLRANRTDRLSRKIRQQLVCLVKTETAYVFSAFRIPGSIQQFYRDRR